MLSRSSDEAMTAREVVSAFEEVLANLPSDTAIENLSPVDVANYYLALAQETKDEAREFAAGVALNVKDESHAFKSQMQRAEDYIEMARRLSGVSSVGDDPEIYEDLRETRKHVLHERRRQEIQRLKEELVEMDRSLTSIKRPVGIPLSSADEDHDYIDDYSYRQERKKHLLLMADIYAKEAEADGDNTIGPARKYRQNEEVLRGWVRDLDSEDSDKKDKAMVNVKDFLRDRRDHLLADPRSNIDEKPGYIYEGKLADRYK